MGAVPVAVSAHDPIASRVSHGVIAVVVELHTVCAITATS